MKTARELVGQLALEDPMLSVIHTGAWMPGEIHRSAVITQDGQYRWSLQRQWDKGPMCAWVMLNPSIADAYTDDPTIRRCMNFARDWGYGGISVVNLYALRSTDPKALWQHPDPIGPHNDEELAFVAANCPLTVLAWGGNAPSSRAVAATDILHRTYEHDGHQLAVLGWTKNDQPRHPLYMRANTRPQPWYGEELHAPTTQEAAQ